MQPRPLPSQKLAAKLPLKADLRVEGAALGTPRTLHIGVVRIDIRACFTAEQAVFAGRWFYPQTPEFRI